MIAFTEALRECDPKFPHGRYEEKLRTDADARAVVRVITTIGSFSDQELVLWAPCVTRLLDHLSADLESVVKIILRTGVPELLRIEQRLRGGVGTGSGAADDAWMGILGSLVKTCSEAGGERLISAIRDRLIPRHYRWSFIFANLVVGRVQREMLYAEYRHRLPPDEFVIYLLKLGNAVCLNDPGADHPMDQPDAADRFFEWIHRPETPRGVAMDAVIALSFITADWARDLRRSALDHPVREVRLEAAWGMARLEDEAGALQLAAECHDFRIAGRAAAYLREFALDRLIPPEAWEPEFRLKCDLSDWVAHPDGGYGMPAEEIDIVHRVRAGRLGHEHSEELCVLKYRVRDRWGIDSDGIGFGVGSSDSGELFWCTACYQPEHIRFDDMVAAGVFTSFRQTHVKYQTGSDADAWHSLIEQWQGEAIEMPEVDTVVLIDPPLAGMPSVIAVFSGFISDDESWLMIESPPVDGDGCFPYPKRLRPEGTTADDVLSEHAGRRLLGWPTHGEESSIVATSLPPPISPEAIAGNFEQMLHAAETGGPEIGEILMGYWGAKIPESIQEYAAAVRTLDDSRRFLSTAARLIPLIKDDGSAVMLAMSLLDFRDETTARSLTKGLSVDSMTENHAPMLCRIRYRLGEESSALMGFRKLLEKVEEEFRIQSAEWKRWRIKWEAEKYDVIRQELEECVGTRTGGLLAEWGLPTRL